MRVGPGTLVHDNASAVIASGPEPSNRGTPVDINTFHSRAVAKGFHASSECGLSRDNVPHAYISARENDSRDCERKKFAGFPS